jgi:hypothetical protein
LIDGLFCEVNEKFMRSTLRFLLVITVIIFSCNNSEQAPAKEDNHRTTDTVSSSTPGNETVPVAVSTPYRSELEFGKIKFTITSPQLATGNTFTIAPSGFTMLNDTLTIDCEGTVFQTEVSDLDGDRGPEVLVVTQSGENKMGKAYIFSGNKNRSMGMVSLPDFTSNAKNAEGYAGHDEFAFVESTFSHRFPLYEDGKPLSKTRQFQYKLKPGEAMKQLKLDETIEY